MTQSLHLTIVAPGNLPLHERVRSVSKGPFRIGRDDDNDWVIPDPTRRVSRHHCTIDIKAGVFVVIDTSANGLVINNAEQPLGRGNSAIVNDGDRLHLAYVAIEAALIETGDGQRDPFLAILPKAGRAGLSGEGLQGSGAAASKLDATQFGGNRPSPSFPPNSVPPSLPWADDGPALPPPSSFASFPPILSFPPIPWRKETEPDHVPAEMQFIRPVVALNTEIPPDWDAQDSFDPPAVSAFVPIPAPRVDAGAMPSRAIVMTLVEALARIEKASGAGSPEALLTGDPEAALARLARLDPEWARDELLSLANRVAEHLTAARMFRPADGDETR